MGTEIKYRRVALLGQLGKMVWRRKVWFLIPFLVFLTFGMLVVIIMESPALIPFFYAIF